MMTFLGILLIGLIIGLLARFLTPGPLLECLVERKVTYAAGEP